MLAVAEQTDTEPRYLFVGNGIGRSTRKRRTVFREFESTTAFAGVCPCGHRNVTNHGRMLFTQSKDRKTFPVLDQKTSLLRTCFRDFSSDTLEPLKSLLGKTLTLPKEEDKKRKLPSMRWNYGKLRPTKNELQAYLR